MTSPAAPPPDPPSRPSRLVEAMTWLVLFATALVVVAAALPALLRAGGVGAHAFSGSPRLSPHPVDPAFHPSLPGAPDEEPEADDNEGDVEPPAARMRPAVVRSKVTLHVAAGEDMTPTGEVAAGESVFVVREKGDWALVLRSGTEGVLMGWTEKQKLVIR